MAQRRADIEQRKTIEVAPEQDAVHRRAAMTAGRNAATEIDVLIFDVLGLQQPGNLIVALCVVQGNPPDPGWSLGEAPRTSKKRTPDRLDVQARAEKYSLKDAEGEGRRNANPLNGQ